MSENIIPCLFLNSTPAEGQFCKESDIVLSRIVLKTLEVQLRDRGPA